MVYKCKKCGSKEFISQPNQYDVFQSQNGKLVLKSTEFIDDELVLYCRECSEIIEFDEDDIIM
jgi:hypothetical protein